MTGTSILYATDMDYEAQLRLGFMQGTALCEIPTTHYISFFFT
jgi:hypothetical protein